MIDTPRLRVVLAAADADAPSLRDVLAAAGADVVASANTADEAMRVSLQQRPDLVVAREGIGGASPIELTEQLWARAPGIGCILVATDGGDELERHALIAGALAVVALPDGEFDPARLTSALREARSALQRRRTLLAQSQPRSATKLGTAIVIASAKGGVGRSFIAAGIASWLAETSNVTLCDLDLQFGDIATWGREDPPTRSIEQLAAVVAAGEITLDDVRAVSEQRFGKVSLLAGPRTPVEGTSWAADRGARSVRLVGALRRWFDWIVVDGLAGVLEPVVRLARGAQLVVVVTGCDIGQLRATQRYLQLLDRYAPSPRIVVANRAGRGDRKLAAQALPRERLLFVGEDKTFARRLVVEGLAAPQQRGRGVSRALAKVADAVAHAAPEQG